MSSRPEFVRRSAEGRDLVQGRLQWSQDTGAGVARAWRGHGAGAARACPVTPGAETVGQPPRFPDSLLHTLLLPTPFSCLGCARGGQRAAPPELPPGAQGWVERRGVVARHGQAQGENGSRRGPDVDRTRAARYKSEKRTWSGRGRGRFSQGYRPPAQNGRAGGKLRGGGIREFRRWRPIGPQDPTGPNFPFTLHPDS
eukprot:gene25880-biopygen6033